MHSENLIVGYGYCGFFLANHLVEQGQMVRGWSRQEPVDHALTGLLHEKIDINQSIPALKPRTVVYYLVPPLSTSQEYNDSLLQKFLTAILPYQPQKIIYFGSSSVYGNHHGNWVDEDSPCRANNRRQLCRQSAEQMLSHWSKKNHIPAVILRIAGIYGPWRLPYTAVKQGSPIICPEEAPYINHIYVEDLVKSAAFLASHPYEGILNIADGQPHKMGFLQELLSRELSLPKPLLCTWQEAWDNASEMKREFMQNNKRLRIDRLTKLLDKNLLPRPPALGIKASLAKEKGK